MRTCPRCGAGNHETVNFCAQCGSPLQQAGARTCPSGRHPMDPSWTECAYCGQGSAAPPPPLPASGGRPGAGRIPTIMESSYAPAPPASGGRSGAGRIPTVMEGGYAAAPPLPAAPRPAVRPGTLVEDPGGRAPLPPRPVSPPSAPVPPTPYAAAPVAPSPVAARRATVVLPQSPPGTAPSDGQPVVAPHVNRRIVGILVTYSWSRDGQIFPVREGRNFIGRDTECEICIPDDSALSGRNSYITFRQNFIVGDMMANMNGTDLDGSPLDGHQDLHNYATIRAGATHFTFIACKPPQAE